MRSILRVKIRGALTKREWKASAMKKDQVALPDPASTKVKFLKSNGDEAPLKMMLRMMAWMGKFMHPPCDCGLELICPMFTFCEG